MYQFFIALTFIVFNAFREIYRGKEIRTDNFLADANAEILSNGNNVVYYKIRDANCSFTFA